MSRFDKLMGAVNKTKSPTTSTTPETQTAEAPPLPPPPGEAATTSKAKSSSKDYQRTTVYLTKKLHKEMKAAAVQQEIEMSDIVETAVWEWLERQKHSDV